MYFELDGVTYVVKFHREGTKTFATLFVINNEGGMDITDIVGMSNPYHTDRFEKKKGRKIAFADLLWQVSRPDNEGVIPQGLSKEDRQNIWQKYFEKHSK